MRLKERYKQMPMFPIFIDNHGVEHWTMMDAAKACGRVTLRNGFLPRAKKQPWNRKPRLEQVKSLIETGKFTRPTLIKEVDFSNPEMPSSELLSIPYGNAPSTLEEVAEVGLDALMEDVHDWDKMDEGKPVMMPFSAGYGSRILAIILRRLGFGDDDITFLTWSPECKEAAAILPQIGWGGAEHRQWDGEVDFFSDGLLDWETLGRSTSDVYRVLPGSMAICPPDPGHRYINATFDGTFSGSSIRGMPNLADGVVKSQLEYQCPQIGEDGADWFIPFIGDRTLRMILKYDWKPHNYDDIKREMLRQLQPGIEKIDNPKYGLSAYMKKHGALKCWELSAETREEMGDNLRSSWIVKEDDWIIEGECPKYVKPYDFWIQRYMYAAIVDALVDEGVEVRL